MKFLSRSCPNCGVYSRIDLPASKPLECSSCHQIWPALSDHFQFDECPFCQGRQFYIQKDFNQAMGCGIMLIAIVFVPATYGLSLPVFALIDWLLYQTVPMLAVCYRCGAEYRGFQLPTTFKPFLHHIGEKYDR